MTGDLLHQRCRVVESVAVARDTYRLRLESPEIADRIRPGQFVMLRLTNGDDPLLGRPFALYDTFDVAGSPGGFDVVYLVVGKATALLAKLRPGDALDVWGPLGNGFSPPSDGGSVTFVAGGIGQTPFLAFARQLLGQRGYGGDVPRRLAAAVTMLYGARAADYLAGLDDFRAAGVDLHLATDDGRIGHCGYVTDLARKLPAPTRYYGCGPEPMLATFAKLAAERGVPCDVSLETPMACGLGICFSCVARVTTADGWDYKRVCVDGPIFDAASLVW